MYSIVEEKSPWVEPQQTADENKFNPIKKRSASPLQHMYRHPNTN
jgi:hypothetical protein